MTAQRFGRARRVRRRGDYKRAFASGTRVNGRHFTLVMVPNAAGRTRLGIVASRKLGNAVERNRAKRLIREIFRQTALPEGGPGVDLVVIPRDSVFNAAFPELENDFRGALRRGFSRLHVDVNAAG